MSELQERFFSDNNNSSTASSNRVKHKKSNSNLSVVMGTSIPSTPQTHRSNSNHSTRPRRSSNNSNTKRRSSTTDLSANHIPRRSSTSHSKQKLHSSSSKINNKFSSQSLFSNDIFINPTLNSLGKDYLNDYLLDRGFLKPQILLNSNDLNISLAPSSNHVYLPTFSNSTDEYLQSLNGFGTNDDNVIDPTQQQNSFNDQQTNESNSLLENIDGDTDIFIETNRNDSNTENDNSSNTTTTLNKIQYNESMTPFTFAIIISVNNKPMSISDINVELFSRVKVFWHHGVPPTKAFKEEVYKLSSMNWNLNSKNYNLFIPINVSTNDKIIQNDSDNLNTTRFFKNYKVKERNYTDRIKSIRSLFSTLNTTNPQTLSPGDYVYICPLMFSNHIPETFSVPSGRVDYIVSLATKSLDKNSIVTPKMPSTLSPTNSIISSRKASISSMSTESDDNEKVKNSSIVGKNFLSKVKNTLNTADPLHHHNVSHQKSTVKEDDQSYLNNDKLLNDESNVYFEYPVHLVRAPPAISISTADKPVYISRVWSDTLSYEISFEKKFIPLNSSIPIKIKLTPINKDPIIIKRIRVSVVEKITFVSKNLEFEYEQIDIISKDPYNPYYAEFNQKKKKERNLSLLEIRTKSKGSRAIREEIIENALNDNLLSYRTGANPSKDPKKNEEYVPLSESFCIESFLNFPKHNELDKKNTRYLPPYGVDLFSQNLNNDTSQQNDSSQNVPHKASVMNLWNNSRRNSLKHEDVADSRTSIHSNNSASIANHNSNLFSHVSKINSDAGIPIRSHCKLSTPKRGLYLDSMNFSNIHVKHKLEVMFRIAKQDDSDPEKKVRNYEVLIDIPVILISEFCDTSNMELPSYDTVTKEINSHIDLSPDNNNSRRSSIVQLPSFEEAMSQPNTPPYISPIESPILQPAYKTQEYSMHQINLSRNSSIVGTESDLFRSHPKYSSHSKVSGRSLSISAGSAKPIASTLSTTNEDEESSSPKKTSAHDSNKGSKEGSYRTKARSNSSPSKKKSSSNKSRTKSSSKDSSSTRDVAHDSGSSTVPKRIEVPRRASVVGSANPFGPSSPTSKDSLFGVVSHQASPGNKHGIVLHESNPFSPANEIFKQNYTLQQRRSLTEDKTLDDHADNEDTDKTAIPADQEDDDNDTESTESATDRYKTP